MTHDNGLINAGLKSEVRMPDSKVKVGIPDSKVKVRMPDSKVKVWVRMRSKMRYAIFREITSRVSRIRMSCPWLGLVVRDNYPQGDLVSIST